MCTLWTSAISTSSDLYEIIFLLLYIAFLVRKWQSGVKQQLQLQAHKNTCYITHILIVNTRRFTSEGIVPWQIKLIIIYIHALLHTQIYTLVHSLLMVSQIQHSLREWLINFPTSHPPTTTSTGPLAQVFTWSLLFSGQATERSTGLLILVQLCKEQHTKLIVGFIQV